MDKKLGQILNLVDEYIKDKRSKEDWKPGEDWLPYSGPLLDGNEYKAAVKSLLSEWLIFGEISRDFELQFAEKTAQEKIKINF